MLSPPLVDHTRYICHAPARLRVGANMFVLACGYAAICLLAPLSSAAGATQAGCGVEAIRERLQERHFYSCDNFQLNRAAALAEWRQLLSA